MKILLVDIEYDYGQQQRGINTIREYGYQAAMKSLGHEVVPFFYDRFLGNTEPLQAAVLAKAEEEKPDLIFFILFKEQFRTETLDKLKTKFPTMNWFGDDSWRFDSFTKVYAPHFSHCVTTDKYSLPKYEQLGIENVILSQWAAIEDQEESQPFEGYKHDVSFIGARNPYRAWFIQQLEKQGLSVDCFGHGWKNGPVSNDEMKYLFRHSKINLNLSNSVNLDVRYLFSSLQSLIHSFRSSKVNSQIKARNFEIPYHGGFQLSDYTPSLEDYFDIGKDLACYNTLQDAVTQIQFFLAQDALRETLRETGAKKSRECHGYSHRFQAIFDGLKL